MKRLPRWDATFTAYAKSALVAGEYNNHHRIRGIEAENKHGVLLRLYGAYDHVAFLKVEPSDDRLELGEWK